MCDLNNYHEILWTFALNFSNWPVLEVIIQLYSPLRIAWHANSKNQSFVISSFWLRFFQLMWYKLEQ